MRQPSFEHIQSVIATARDALSRRMEQSVSIEQEIQRVLDSLSQHPPVKGELQLSDHPITHVAGAALQQPHASGASELTRVLESTIGELPWKYSYPERADDRELSQRIAFAELVGPEAPFVSHDVCLGLTLIAPQTHYLSHYHPATELYYIITGASDWTCNGVTNRRCPGAFILHPSMAHHAMRTGTEALLALYTWSGVDILTSSKYSDA